MPRLKRVQHLIVRDIKERPLTRQAIQNEGLKPLILSDSKACYWDETTVSEATGRRKSIGTGLRKQMVRMAARGEFGRQVQNAIIDVARYYYILEHLLEYPNEALILSEGLSVLEYDGRESVGA